jgi:hypothetical protein
MLGITGRFTKMYALTESCKEQNSHDGVENGEPADLQMLLCVFDDVVSAGEMRLDPSVAYACDASENCIYHVCVYIYIYTHTYICMYVYIYIHIHMYIHNNVISAGDNDLI